MTDRELIQRWMRPGAIVPVDMNTVRILLDALRERLAQPEQEIDWKDQYEKQKRRAEMWRDKYEAIAGPDECVYPAQPEQEPVAWMFEDDEDNGHKTFRQTPPSPEAVAYLAKWNRPAWAPLYTAPQRREWVGLRDEEVRDLWSWSMTAEAERTANTQQHAFARAIEAKLKEKNA